MGRLQHRPVPRIPVKQTIPIVFGNAKRQRMIIELYEGKSVPVRTEGTAMLVGSGLVCIVKRNGRNEFALDRRHPAYRKIMAVLGELSKKECGPQPKIADPLPAFSMSPRFPFTHVGESINFRAILYVTLAGAKGITKQELEALMPDQASDQRRRCRDTKDDRWRV
jgi:hypothetical protein